MGVTDTGLARPAVATLVDPLPELPRSDWAWRRAVWPDPTAVLAEFDIGPGTALVDVGDGGGYFALPAAALVAPAPVYVLNRDGTLLDELEAAAVDRGIENLTTLSGDAAELTTLLPDRVDVVLVVDAFTGIEAPTAFAEGVSRSLEPGGRLIVVDWRPDAAEAETDRGPPVADRLSPTAVASAVRPAGLERTDELAPSPAHYGLVFKRGHDV